MLWSPVTITTSGFSAVMRGMAASSSSMRLDLGSEVAVLAGLVGVFEMDEEEVVIVPKPFQRVHLVADSV